MKLDRTKTRPVALYGGMMIFRSAFVVLVLAGCSPSPEPVSQSAKDPSSPRAAEGRDPMPAPPAAAADTRKNDAGAVVYVCPMHPEVTSTTPGSTCPKCNMKLVPKE